MHTNAPDGRAVVGDDHQLGLAHAQRLEAGLVAQRVLARLHDQSQTAVDALLALLALFRDGCHGDDSVRDVCDLMTNVHGDDVQTRSNTWAVRQYEYRQNRH